MNEKGVVFKKEERRELQAEAPTTSAADPTRLEEQEDRVDLGIFQIKMYNTEDNNFSANLKGWQVTSFTERLMTVKLDFSDASTVSSKEDADELQISFNSTDWFFDMYG